MQPHCGKQRIQLRCSWISNETWLIQITQGWNKEGSSKEEKSKQSYIMAAILSTLNQPKDQPFQAIYSGRFPFRDGKEFTVLKTTKSSITLTVRTSVPEKK